MLETALPVPAFPSSQCMWLVSEHMFVTAAVRTIELYEVLGCERIQLMLWVSWKDLLIHVAAKQMHYNLGVCRELSSPLLLLKVSSSVPSEVLKTRALSEHSNTLHNILSTSSKFTKPLV
jgi:hypothetical protein